VPQFDKENDDDSAEHHARENEVLGHDLSVADNVQFHFLAVVKPFVIDVYVDRSIYVAFQKKHVLLRRAQPAIRGK